MPTPEKPVYDTGSDGLPARISGEWARRKHHYLRNYCGITTKSMRGKFRLVFLDVMAGPGLCRLEKTGEEFPGSPFVALDHEFSAYYFIEGDRRLFNALEHRLADHPKRDSVTLINENWINAVKSDRLLFGNSTLVVAFIDPTGVADLPISAVHRLIANPRIDLLITIQHRLGIVWNAPHYKRSASENSALTKFLGHSEWRSWEIRDSSEMGRRAIDDFCNQIEASGFIGSRHISIPEDNPYYRFACFSRHPLGEKFWSAILKFDEKGQREFPF